MTQQNPPPANPDEDDLIIASDSGDFWVVKLTSDGVPEGTPPYKLDPAQTRVPKLLQDSGATLAVMPPVPQGGGCTCVLLNVKSIRRAVRADLNPDALMKAATDATKPK